MKGDERGWASDNGSQARTERGTMAEEAFEAGETVKVRSDCPHTLPAYARMMSGVVLGPTEDGMISVKFGDDRIFPISPEWLVRVPSPQP